jgi:hypothetical protein
VCFEPSEEIFDMMTTPTDLALKAEPMRNLTPMHRMKKVFEVLAHNLGHLSATCSPAIEHFSMSDEALSRRASSRPRVTLLNWWHLNDPWRVISLVVALQRRHLVAYGENPFSILT